MSIRKESISKPSVSQVSRLVKYANWSSSKEKTVNWSRKVHLDAKVILKALALFWAWAHIRTLQDFRVFYKIRLLHSESILALSSVFFLGSLMGSA